MSLWAILVTGLLAGGASCAAVQGGLLAGAVARRRGDPEPTARETRAQRRRRRPAVPVRSLRDDATPVGAFLAGKLVSHTLLGALLGLLGDAVQLGVRTRAVVQITAGVLMLVLALDLFGVDAVRRAGR